MATTLRKLTPLALAAGAAGAAAGYYFYASKDAKKNRGATVRWAREMKDTVVEKARDLKDLDKGALLSVIDTAAESYRGIRSLNRGDIEKAVGELKRNWQLLMSEAAPARGTKRASRTKGTRSRARS